MSDFIDDLNRRIIEGMTKLGITPETAAMVAAEMVMDVRRDWAGERPFIGSREPDSRQSERNREIIRAHKAGESMGQLAKRHKISRQRVDQIIKG